MKSAAIRAFVGSTNDLHLFALTWVRAGEVCCGLNYFKQLTDEQINKLGFGRAEAECAMKLSWRYYRELRDGRTERQITAGMRLDGSLKPLLKFNRSHKENAS